MRVIVALFAFALGLILAVASLPWIALGMGYAMMGDDGRAETWMEASPLWRWLDHVEGVM